MSTRKKLDIRSDDEDDEEDDEEEVEYSGMIQPPLIHQLRNILTEYPDGGQILKELIQNAEDAGANIMQIFYDQRAVIPSKEIIAEKKTPFRTYFKGPSLCFYNDALFTEKDWMGIKMMYNSIKVFDPLKVGKFGLGFKSVFHITEYPIIISGEYLLVIDPNKDSSKVCQTMKLRTIHRAKSRKMAYVKKDCIRGLVGLFGFSERSLESGFFNGSILRLPLRQTPTELSDVVYDDIKAHELLESFKEEASVCLLFLKSLSRIDIINEQSLNIAEPSSEPGCKDFEVFIGGDNTHEVVRCRQEFVQRIKENEESTSNKTIRNSYKVTLVTDDHDEAPKHRSWSVVNMYMVEGMSEEMKRLGRDKDLSYSPYVGAAIPYTKEEDFIGHVFCFLPLPLQRKSLTGLPVHVNGFLALSQNRRHIKWPTVDQVRHSTHQDKPIRWNECLVKEALSEVYIQLVQALIDDSGGHSNPKHLVENVYQAIPDIEAVEDDWSIIIEPFLDALKKTRFLYTKSTGGEWIKIHNAVFVNSVQKEYQSCVKEILDEYEEKWVDIPEHVWYICQHLMDDVCIVTPGYLSSVLKTSTKYENCSREVKLDLLSFLLQEEDVTLLDGLDLLPVASGEFLQFDSFSRVTIYLCSETVKRLLPGLDEIIVSDLPKNVHSTFEEMAEEETYQIRFPENDIERLVERTIRENFGASDKLVQWNPNDVKTGSKWLETLWTYLSERYQYSLEAFHNLPLVPVCLKKVETKSTNPLSNLMGLVWASDSAKAYDTLQPLSVNMMLQKQNKKAMPKPVQACMEAMHIKVLAEIPEYLLIHPEINKFIHYPTPEGFLEILECTEENDIDRKVTSFNASTTFEERDSFIKFMSDIDIVQPSARKMLRQLELFLSNEEKYICVESSDKILLDTFPVAFPETILKCPSHQSRSLAMNLGASVLRTEDAIETILISCISCFYADEEKSSFMKYFMKNISTLKEDQCLMQLAKQVQFVPTKSGSFQKPVDVYDPYEPTLVDLFLDDDLFPDLTFAKQNKTSLRILGMREIEEVIPKEILKIANELDKCSLNDQIPKEQVKRRNKQSKALMKLLERKMQEFNSRQIQTLRSLHFVIPSKRPDEYPTMLPWKTQDTEHVSFLRPIDTLPFNMKNLVGSTRPLFDAEVSQDLAHILSNGSLPSSDCVVDQLEIISTKYEERNRFQFLPLIAEIFTYMAENFNGESLREKFRGRKIMWNGNGFCHIQNIYCKENRDDIMLEPFIFFLPPELKYPNVVEFCRNIGCYGRQDVELYLSIQKQIKEKHHGNKEFNEGEVRRDLDLLIKILNRLKQHSYLDERDVLFPVHTDNERRLEIRRAKDCAYCNSEWLKMEASEDGDIFNFIHEDVPLDTAEKLGVPSLTEDLLMETEGIESWGQKEPLTRRLHNLLKEYKDGFAVPKEIVQNADDGGATKVCFLYDERENDEYRCRLIDENMAECHGPALWAYNNREFTRKDLENITKLSGATKEDDALTIGKFGLGFCSVYNLTDVPSFITGENIVIFDPHVKYLGKAVRKGNPGLKINLSKKRNKVMLRRMKNQFQPFEGVFGCEISETDGNYFHGTLFRLPLRNQRQADTSEISDKPYDRSEMNEFIDIFKKNAGNLLLFTQNIETIEFYHLNRKATTPNEKTLLYRIHRDLIKNPLNGTPLSCMNNFMKSRFPFMKEGQDVKATQLMRIAITSNDKNSQTSKLSSEAYWLVSWASGSKRSLVFADETKVKGAIPFGAVGCLLSSLGNDNFEFRSLATSPHGFYRESHVFCYLPLPVTTKQSVHVNGSFAITPDRRQLATKTKDDKSEFETTWNKVMFQDTLVRAYLLLLESLKEMNVRLDNSEYYNIWPKRNEEIDSLETCLCKSFYEEIVSDLHCNLFRSNGLWLSFGKCVFLDPDLSESDIGANVSESTSFFGYDNQNVLSLPRSILKSIQDANSELDLKKKMFSAVHFFLNIFFPNVSHEFWDHNTRARLISYALDHHFEDVMNTVEDDVRFIPSLPDGKLKSPKDLFHPYSDLKKIFSDDEGYFIHTEYGKPFMTDARLSMLEELGLLKDELPDNMLIERAESIKVLFTQCKTCAIDRSKHLLGFLNNKFQGRNMDDTEEEQFITLLKKTEFLPVLPKPKNWQIPWYADTMWQNDGNSNCSKHQSNHVAMKDDICLCNPSQMFALECQHLVGTQAPVLNERLLHYSNFTPLLKKLGVRYKNSTIIEYVLDHLRTLSENAVTTNESAETVLLIEKECTEIYLFLQKQIKSEISQSQVIDKVSSLKNFRSIFVRGRFWFPHQVCTYLSYDCSPYLIGLDTSQLRHCYDFFQFLNIELSFSVQVITDVLLELKQKYDLKQPIQKEDSIRICNLLQLLAETMTKENVPSEYPSKMDIYVPDEHNVLKPIKDVCFDDVSDVKKTNNYIHDTISRSTAVTIGIKSKARGKLRQHSKSFRPFGQREELISKINRILSGYQCDVGILKELVQNADDAKATEIRIITDFQKHSAARVFDDCWKPLQGPAILVYNNSSFSQDDLYGIQKIGIGSKADDPTKTGQFGVGFNAVYHLTDVPSFLTKGKEIDGGETLCVMDPHCKYVPGATHEYPGMQYVDLAELRESFPDVFSVFHERHFPQDKGTIFRFPLRTEKFAKNSEFSNEIVTEAFIKELLEVFKKDMPICLLFLDHVTSVSLHSVENNRMKELHRVQIKLTKEQAARKRKYVQEWKEAALKARDLEQPVDLSVIQSVFEATVSESGGSDHKWIISQRFGHRKDALPEKLSEAFRQKIIGLLPRGGVALCKDYLQRTSQRENKDVVIEMKAFCTLPLPLNTGLPVHIDGHFALDHEARRNLWMDDKLEYRSEWNIHLMENVIAPAYIKCVTAWKKDLGLEEHCRIQTNKVRAKLISYYNSFPLFRSLVGDVWKYLVSAFYKELVKMAVPVFLSCRKVGKRKTLISCHPIQNGKSGFQIVFNTLSKELAGTNDRMKIAFQLETIAKEMNMKLVDAPIDIYKCLEKLKINVDTSTPDFFMDFLRSFNSGMEGDCMVCDTSRNITHTKFKSIENLQTCLLYCMNSNSFKTKAVGVPLCLTEDLMVREFSKEKQIIVSQYASLFPKSKSEFIAQKFNSLFEGKLQSFPFIKEVSMSDLPMLLERNLDFSYRNERMKVWSPSAEVFPNSQWIDSIWKLLSRIKHSTEASYDACSKLQTISKWCLVPVVHASKTKLCRIQDSTIVVDLATFDGKLKLALQSLNIPFLDRDISDQPLLISSVISFREPKQLLDCLCSHLDSIASKDMRSEHCIEILAYFSERVDDIIKELLNSSKCKEYIRSLPFFVAVQGGHIAVPNQRKVFVLPQGMPSAGIKEWAEKVNTTLLSANTRLRPLYEFLEIASSTFAAVYLLHIFPTWHHLPKENRICHLKFIKALVLYHRWGCENADEKALQTALKILPFVESPNHNSRVASSFFNNEHDIFKHLCHDSEFPPEPFRNHDWNPFMLFAGMKNEVDSDMLLQFARRIQSECNGSTSTDLELKSRILVKHFLKTTSLQNERVLLGIKHISFISRHCVSQTLKEMHDQHNANKLVSFSGSSLKCHESILWSNTPLLPGWATPFGERIKKNLDIREPSLIVVCDHVTKLCTRLSMKVSKDGLKDDESVKKIMVENYEFLTKNGLEDSSSKKTLMTLRGIPLVFLPLKRTFVPCSKIVIGLKEENEIPGYLIKSPEAYGAFNELFVHLGTKRDGDCTVYTDVLAAIQSSSGNQRIHPNEMKAVAKAVEFFFSSFPRQCEKLKEKLKDTKLFLPSTKHVLVDVSQLVIVHDDIVGRNLQDAQDIDILIDFKVLEIEYPISEDLFMHLPDHCRPKLLNEILSEQINIQPLQDASKQDEKLLNEFVHSSEFLNGILRVVSRERKLSTTKHNLDDKEGEKIKAGLKRLHFQEVESIDTLFFYREKEIGRKSMKSHYVCNAADGRQIYEILFVRPETMDSKSLASGIDGSLSKALSDSTGESFTKSAKVLLQMCMEYQSPENIRELLNENGFPEYSSSAGTKNRSVFPRLGSIVPDDFHHLLDDSICVFEEDDYVALNVHDQQRRETDDISRTVYVFAKVLERLPFDDELPKQMQKYKVRVRTDRVEIKYAYELYQFSRDRIHHTRSTELVLYTREHDGDSGHSNQTQERHSNERNSSNSPLEHQTRPTLDSRSLKDIFKEVREELKKIWRTVSSPEERTTIIRRLLRKWHPDKNYGNEKKAEEVFKYIKRVIEKLKRGQSISDDDSDDDSNNTNHRRPPRPQPPSGFDDDFFDDDFFDDLFSGCRRDRERWYRSRRSRPQPGRDSSFYDFYEHHRRYEPNPQPYVARQWLRDAKKDLKMAQSSLSAATEEGTFNWTCLICSQAVEKALKAAQYNTDAKKVFDGDNLIHNASSLNSEIKALVQQFVVIVGSTRRMRYPDVVNISRLPSDLYTLSDANKALQHADHIISKISSIIV